MVVGGWDTHGLPIELGVEQTLGITKEDIGTKISVEEYNKACRKEVMKFKDQWDDITIKMGYWVDLMILISLSTTNILSLFGTFYQNCIKRVAL